MKIILLYLTFAFALSSLGFGQKPKQEPSTQQGAGSSGAQRASGSSTLIKSGTMVEGQLQSTVDVRKSKVGDEVVLKTTKAIKQNGETIVPKGSRLVGRVTEVQEKTKSNGASKLGLLFDTVEGRNFVVPVSASVVSITKVMSGNRLADSADSELFATSNSTAQISRGSSGGLLGGTANTVGNVAGTGGGLLNTTTQTVGSVTNSVGQTVGSTSGSVFRTFDGITISNSIAGSVNAGSTLSAANRNIKLEKGVTIGLQLNNSTTSP